MSPAEPPAPRKPGAAASTRKPASARRPTTTSSKAGGRLRLRTDGAARGNPGPAGAGAVLEAEDGTVLEERRQALGRLSNNAAEYRALLLGLDMAHAHKPEHVAVYLDSELLVNQLNGRYKVKHHDLITLYRAVLQSLGGLGKVTFTYVPRGLNVAADRLANLAVDEAAAQTSKPERVTPDRTDSGGRLGQRGRALPHR